MRASRQLRADSRETDLVEKNSGRSIAGVSHTDDPAVRGFRLDRRNAHRQCGALPAIRAVAAEIYPDLGLGRDRLSGGSGAHAAVWPRVLFNAVSAWHLTRYRDPYRP